MSNAEVGVTLLTFSGHRELVTSAAFSGPAGSSVVTASADGTARVWDALFQPELEEVARLPSRIESIDAEDGRLRVTTVDGRVHLLDPDTGEQLGVEKGVRSDGLVRGPDGATAEIRKNTVVLRADGRRTLLEGHRDRVRAVEFSPDGALLATASRDHDVRIWDGTTGEGLRPLQHNSEVRDASFSPDGRWLVSAAFRAALWDPRSGLIVVRLQGHEGPVTAALFDESGRRVVTGGVDGTVRTYDCDVCGDLDELLAIADRRLAVTGRELTPEERAALPRLAPRREPGPEVLDDPRDHRVEVNQSREVEGAGCEDLRALVGLVVASSARSSRVRRRSGSRRAPGCRGATTLRAGRSRRRPARGASPRAGRFRRRSTSRLERRRTIHGRRGALPLARYWTPIRAASGRPRSRHSFVFVTMSPERTTRQKKLFAERNMRLPPRFR